MSKKTLNPAGPPAHVPRPARRRRGAVPVAPARQYAPGWFLQPVLAWWPDFTPSPVQASSETNASASERATLARQRAIAEGRASAHGTMLLPKTPKVPPPAWMSAVPAAVGKC